MQETKTLKMVLCALFAALTAVLSQIAIPIGPVPINLATFAVFCAGTLLGPKLGALSLAVWVALGAAGVPVFSLFRGGLAALVGPTGGFIIGYVPAAFLIGLINEKINKENKTLLYPVSMLAGFFTYFAFGSIWFMYLTNAGLIEALMTCVVPFIPGDLAKIAVATFLVKRLCPVLHNKIYAQP